MKVLLIAPDMFGAPGGIARYCALVAKALNECERVAQLDILVLRDPTKPRIDARYLSGESFRLRAFDAARTAFARATLRQILRGSYDLLISGHANFTPLLFGPGSHGARRVTLVYGTDVWGRLPAYRRLPLHWCDHVLAISDFTRTRAIRSNGLDPERVQVRPNCLDPNFEPSAISYSGGSKLLTVSRLSKEESGKGHMTVLGALPAVIRAFPDVHYEIIGDGDLRPDLEQYAQILRVDGQVTFFGQVSDDEVKRAYSRAGLFVMPSRFEGFGFVFLEAMAYSKPIIAGDRDASPEVVGDAGLLVDPDDCSQVAAAIIELLSNADKRRELIDNGRRRLEAFRYPGFRDGLLSQLGLMPSTAILGVPLRSVARFPSGTMST